MTGRSGSIPGRGGKVRAARLTDLSALGELSRLAQAEDSRRALAGAPAGGSADRRLHPLPAPAGRVPAERPALRPRARRAPRRAPPRRARQRARRVDDRGARRGRPRRRRRHPLPAGAVLPSRRRQARGDPLPRRLRRRRRQRGAVHAGRLRALRRRAGLLPAVQRAVPRAVHGGRGRRAGNPPRRRRRTRSPSSVSTTP